MSAPRGRQNAIGHGELGFTAAIALRLGKYFDVDPRWFLNMQTQYDLQVQGERLDDKVAAIESRRLAGD